jgi:hypothetical protein
MWNYQNESLPKSVKFPADMFLGISLWRLFGSEREEVRGGQRKLNNEKLHNLYSPSNILKMIESLGMRWVGFVDSIREKIQSIAFV